MSVVPTIVSVSSVVMPPPRENAPQRSKSPMSGVEVRIFARALNDAAIRSTATAARPQLLRENIMWGSYGSRVPSLFSQNRKHRSSLKKPLFSSGRAKDFPAGFPLCTVCPHVAGNHSQPPIRPRFRRSSATHSLGDPLFHSASAFARRIDPALGGSHFGGFDGRIVPYRSAPPAARPHTHASADRCCHFSVGQLPTFGVV